MQIELIGHAGFSTEIAGRRIVTDPWLSGKVFNESWALVAQPKPVDWARVDYLFITHEHPDHLHFPTLRNIPENAKRRLVVLHQKHASARVAESLIALGFRVRELPIYRWHELEPGLRVYCGSVGSKDAFLAIDDQQGGALLNMNDCVVNLRQLRSIKKELGSISVLLTQFSIGNWVGNDHDELEAGKRKLEQLKEQIAIFQPSWTVPFASFVYFANHENARMNAWAHRPDAIAALGLPKVQFLFPGDRLDLRHGAEDSARAIARYRDAWAAAKIDPTPPEVERGELDAAIERSLASLHAALPNPVVRLIDPLLIEVHDHRAIVEVDPARGTHRWSKSRARGEPRFTMCSQVAWYFFNFDWGPDTTIISGMYRDRDFARRGKHVFFRMKNLSSTRVLDLKDGQQSLRTAEFLWRKRRELFGRWLGGEARV